MTEEKIFKLKGKTLAIIDWANVYGWFRKLKWEISPKKLFDYLKTYPEIIDIRFYFGIEKGNKKSEEFHNLIKSIGYNLVTKEIKWVPVFLEDQNYLRKIIKIIYDSLDNIDLMVYEDLEAIIETNFLRKILKYPVYRRKCDFDVEITRDVLLNLNKVDGIILFSGDGDYAPLAEEVIKAGKQMILVFAQGCRGKEYENFDKGLYQCSVKKLRKFIQK